MGQAGHFWDGPGRGVVVKPDWIQVATARPLASAHACPSRPSRLLRILGEGVVMACGCLAFCDSGLPQALWGEGKARCSRLRASAQAHARQSCLVGSACSHWGCSHPFLGAVKRKGRKRATSGECEVLVLFLERSGVVCTHLVRVVLEGENPTTCPRRLF